MPDSDFTRPRTAQPARPQRGPKHGHQRGRQHGFTLVEAIMVIVLTGVLAGVISRFMVMPVMGYLSASARANVADTADGALRRIGRDLRIALPNSVRINAAGTALELIPVSAAARYVTSGTGALDFGTADTDFDLLGPAITLPATQWLVVYNLGPGITGSDAYAGNTSAAEQASSNRRSITTGAGSVTHLSISSAAGLPITDSSPPYRAFVVGAPITYRCDLAAGTLTRYTGYGFQSAQPDPPSGGSSALLATNVGACSFSLDATAVAARAALVSLQLQIRADTVAGTETVSLHHAVHVDNLP